MHQNGKEYTFLSSVPSLLVKNGSFYRLFFSSVFPLSDNVSKVGSNVILRQCSHESWLWYSFVYIVSMTHSYTVIFYIVAISHSYNIYSALPWRREEWGRYHCSWSRKQDKRQRNSCRVKREGKEAEEWEEDDWNSDGKASGDNMGRTKQVLK